MPNNRFLPGILLVFFSISSAAQPDTISSKVTYFNALYAGGLLAKKTNGSSLTASFVQGIRYKTISLGIGMGYDSYLDWRTLPVFASLNFDFAHIRQNAFFIQFNAGYSKAWIRVSENDQNVYDVKGGPLIHPLLGYRIRSNQFSLYFSAGYKWQNITYEQTSNWWMWAYPPIDGYPSMRYIIDRNIERFSVQIGLGFH
jgi:hypothetical protein